MIQSYRQKLDRLLDDHQHARRQVQVEEDALREAQDRLQNAQEAQQAIQQIARTIQESCHRQVSEIASRCLQAVFGKDTYRLEIRFEEKRGKTEARIVLVTAEGELHDPINECGGGIIDVISFSLRLAALLLSFPQKRRLLVLDEYWKHLSARYRPAMRRLLEKISQEMNVQIVYVTHAEELQAGKVIRL